MEEWQGILSFTSLTSHVAEKRIKAGTCCIHDPSSCLNFREKEVIILWWQLVHKKQNLVSIVDASPESGSYRQCQDWFCHVWSCSCTYRPQRTSRQTWEETLCETDFAFSNEKIGDYYIGAHRVITNLFGCREIQAYVTATEKEHGTKRLFFSTIFPEDLQIFRACQEKQPQPAQEAIGDKYIFRCFVLVHNSWKQAVMERRKPSVTLQLYGTKS